MQGVLGPWRCTGLKTLLGVADAANGSARAAAVTRGAAEAIQGHHRSKSRWLLQLKAGRSARRGCATCLHLGRECQRGTTSALGQISSLAHCPVPLHLATPNRPSCAVFGCTGETHSHHGGTDECSCAHALGASQLQSYRFCCNGLRRSLRSFVSGLFLAPGGSVRGRSFAESSNPARCMPRRCKVVRRCHSSCDATVGAYPYPPARSSCLAARRNSVAL